MTFAAVVFDLDGTLIDSVPDVRAAVNRVLGELGRPSVSLEDIKGMIGDFESSVSTPPGLTRLTIAEQN